MAEADRQAAVRAIGDVARALSKYSNPFSAGALVKLISSGMVAHAGGGMDRWKARLVEKARHTGPYVDAIFSAL